MINSRIHYNKKKLSRFCRENSIARLAVFGSATKGDFSDKSDLDILVDFQSGSRIGLLKFIDIEESLCDIFSCAASIDLITQNALSPYLRDDILKSCVVLYEEG